MNHKSAVREGGVPTAEFIADAIAEWDTERRLTAEETLSLARFLTQPRLVMTGTRTVKLEAR